MGFGSYLLVLLTILTFSHAINEIAEFRQVLKEENSLLVLFTEECCKCAMCVEYEVMLGGMSKTLEEMNLKVVKLISPKLKAEYGIKTTPSVVYIRDHIPVLYDGKLDPETMYWWLSDNRDPYTKDLNDDNFEHLTQAATGSTTGDWLVAFYNETCMKKTALYTHLDSVATHLKSRVNVAVVNGQESPETTKRFKVKSCPEVIMFHHGKMYRTTWIPASKLRIFAERLYKEMKAENVPAPQTYFDKLIDHFVSAHLVSVTFAFTMLVIIVLCSMLRKSKQKSD